MGILDGKEIHLRALEPEDLEQLYLWENNTEIWWLGNTLKPYSKDTLKKYLATAHQDIFETRQVRFAISLNHSTPEIIGLIDLYDFDPFHQRAGIGILLGNVAYRNKGYGNQALSLICEYAFSVLHLHQLFCTIPQNNYPSIKLFTNAGFQKTGLRTEWIKTKDGWVDELFFQLSASSWSSRVE
jgi:diamine N-acetyltransferase